MLRKSSLENEKEIDEVAESLKGVGFSGGKELGSAVEEVRPKKESFLTILKEKISRFFGSG